MFKVTTKIDNDKVAGLLCTAFEGGASDCWAQVTDRIKPLSAAKFNQDWAKYPIYSYPLGENGSVTVRDMESDKTYYLTIDTIQKGLSIMADKYPKHFADFISENDDAITGDVFLQCCLLGDVVYG